MPGQQRKEVLEAVYPNEQMIFNEENCRAWAALLRAWRELAQ